MVGRRDTYVLQVKGDSMIDEQIRDGDYVIVEDRKTRARRRDGDRPPRRRRASRSRSSTARAGHASACSPPTARMKPIFVDQDDLRVQGVVIGVLRKY